MPCYRCGERLTQNDRAGAYGSTHNLCRKCHNKLSRAYSHQHIKERDKYAEAWRKEHPKYMKKYYNKNKEKWEEYNQKA